MDKELVKRWVAALRNGKYTQGKQNLRGSVSAFHSDKKVHCCLGVLCDLVDPSGWQGETSLHRLGDGAGMLSRKTVTALGLTTRSSKSKKYGQKELASLNDSHGSDFNKIADVIEKEFA